MSLNNYRLINRYVITENLDRIGEYKMKLGAFVLGIMGGLAVLSHSVFMSGVNNFAFLLRPPEQMPPHLGFASVFIPTVALLGAGMVMSKPKIGAYLMGAATLLTID